MSSVALQIAVILLLILLNGLFAMSETALVSSRKARLRQRANEGDRGARAALELAEEPNRFLSTVQIGISLIGVLAGAFGGATLAEPLAGALRSVPTLAPYAGPVAFGVVVVAITYLSLILGELVPKRLALNGAEGVASRVSGTMRLISVITARGDLDDLIGIASVKDAWARQASGQPTDLVGSLRPPSLVPEGAPATDALEAFKRSGLPMALLIDERGHIEGLVTLTDVLEALVGEVPDEDGSDEKQLVRREDGSWFVDGLLAADEVKERLGLSA